VPVQQSSFIKRVFQYSLSSVSSFLLFLLLISAGRYLGVEDFGRLSFAIAFVFLFDPILDPGLYHFLIRNVAREKDAAPRYLAHALSWKLAVAPLFFLIVFLSVRTIHDSPLTIHAVALMAAATVLKSTKDAFRTSLLAHELFGLDAFSLVLERLSLLAFGVLVLVMGNGVIALCWVFVLVRLVDLLVIASIVHSKVCKIKLGTDLRFIAQMLKHSIPIGGFYITLNVYNYVDTVMLSVMSNDAEVGWYNASYKIYEGLLILPTIIGTVLLPSLSQLFARDDRAEFARLFFFKGVKWIGVLAFLVCANGILLSETIINTLFGAQYQHSLGSLKVLVLGIPFIFLTSFFQVALIAIEKQTTILKIALSGLVVNAGANFILIPRMGSLGAALATVGVELIVLLLLFVYLRNQLATTTPWIDLAGRFAFAISVSLAVSFFLVPGDQLLIRVFLLNMTFLLMLAVVKLVDYDEFKKPSWLTGVRLRA
jgi:O-antigen/teichoic acid export membrane protein